jgi:hypothetical protein
VGWREESVEWRVEGWRDECGMEGGGVEGGECGVEGGGVELRG